jgi:ABC-2 type transport system ATP-binding protein/lipopolysaccharide transport system ATP-binding protein
VSDLAIRCRGVGKSYVLGMELSLQQSLRAIAGKGVKVERFDALRDVTFDVEAGSFFGIVGHNGSGKSTLTQVISGIAVPTTGTVDVWGRILPLLEVGAGFNEELTGRENVMLLGTILGLKPREIEAALPDIVEFAGVARHLETPMKRYSSGMKARLSFATAIGLPADIYVFDEVLAVVDDDFRNRCIDAMREMHARGATIILMSHDLNLIRELCETGMWLNRGEVMQVGPIEDVADAYAHHTATAT